MKKYSISVLITVYNGSSWLEETLNSFYKQEDLHEFNYEIIIGDDNHPANTDEINKTKSILKNFNDNRIIYIKNEKNIGYPLNLKNIVSKAKNDILFLLAQDDLLAKDALKKTHDAFLLDDDIGVVTRPYFWFMNNELTPVRVIRPLNKTKIINIINDINEFPNVLETLGQLTGLAYKRELLTIPFNENIFPAHIYPFLGIFKKYKCVFLEDYTVAVRIESSQTRFLSSIYKVSPLKSWVDMFNTIFPEKNYIKIRNAGIKNIAKHFMGLIQLKNYSTYKNLLREILYYIKFYPKNLFDFKFYAFSFGAIITPRFFLKQLVDLYKNKINNRILTGITFKRAT